jgi:hypothetical protein
VPEQPRHPHLSRGTPVQVRNRFDGAWTHGFELADTGDDASKVRIRRRSDHVVLPARFDWTEVRPEEVDV